MAKEFKRLPYELEDIGIDPLEVEQKINDVRKEFEEKLTLKDKEYTEIIGKEKNEKESIKKLLEDIKGKQKESSVFCTTCGDNAHRHEMKFIGNDTYQCTGDSCHSKKVLVDINSDYKCRDCGLPHKRPIDESYAKTLTCPFCGGKSMSKFDWKNKLDSIKKAASQ